MRHCSNCVVWGWAWRVLRASWGGAGVLTQTMAPLFAGDWAFCGTVSEVHGKLLDTSSRYDVFKGEVSLQADALSPGNPAIELKLRLRSQHHGLVFADQGVSAALYSEVRQDLRRTLHARRWGMLAVHER